MNTAETTAKILKLAAAFADELRATLSADEVQAIIIQNRAENDPSVCYSHDYCDANMVMEGAWNKAFPDDPCDPMNEAQNPIWNDAWEIAKQAEFDSAQIPSAGRR